jgi:hypothetical protein
MVTFFPSLMPEPPWLMFISTGVAEKCLAKKYPPVPIKTTSRGSQNIHGLLFSLPCSLVSTFSQTDPDGSSRSSSIF